MIDYALLDDINARLHSLRSTQGVLLFDGRDKGNYSGYQFPKTVEMLKEYDPTGLSMGLLLNEMIEATINGSKVNLSQVLREEGFLEKLNVILIIKKDLDAALKSPLERFIARIEEIIARISPDFGTPTSREVACCLRDAIYCSSKSLRMHWVRKDESAKPGSSNLHSGIVNAPTLADFVNQIKFDLPAGAHLARIGSRQTAIAIKQPAYTIYLSTLYVNVHSGDMTEQNAHGSHMAEDLDLDTAVERYPKWHSISYHGSNSKSVDAGFVGVSDLPRSVVIWLAMVLELTLQKVASEFDSTPRLVESLEVANSSAEVISNLPVLHRPSWTLNLPTIESLMAELGFNEWEREFTAPALEGMSVNNFLPVSTHPVGMLIKERKLVEWPEGNGFDVDAISKRAVKFRHLHPGIVGTEAEMNHVVRSVMGYNLGHWLLEHGNMRFDQAWKDCHDSFKASIIAKKKGITALPFTHWSGDAGLHAYDAAHVYAQSKKHKTYNPRCTFDGKSEVDTTLIVSPRSGQELIALMGEENVPKALVEWNADLGWRTDDGWGSDRKIEAPFGIEDRWMFGEGCHAVRLRELSHNVFVGLVKVNRLNLSGDALFDKKETKGKMLA